MLIRSFWSIKVRKIATLNSFFDRRLLFFALPIIKRVLWNLLILFEHLMSLTLFEARVGQFVPRYHIFVYSFHRSRARLTKIGDFVSLTIWLVPKKPFLKFLLQNFWKIWILNFWGSSSISRKLKILTKKIIFLQRFSFFLA